VAALVLAACSGDEGWIEERRYAMGTTVDTIYISRADDRRLRADIDAHLQRYGVDYYAWADGELGRLNAALSRGEVFTASPQLADLLERARDLSTRSGGFFDPGVGELVEAWGFHSADSAPQAPSAALLARWADARRGIADLHIAGNRISAAEPLVVDLGGIAKGEVVDRLLERFAAAGVADVLIDAGGDVRVLGSRSERAWTIGIQAPRERSGLLGAIPLNDGEAAFTSGDYERFFDSDDGRRHHLLDPRSGMPATHTQAVTVVADNGALADAAATAVFVAGPEHWREVAAAMGVDHVLRVGADGAVEMTPPMRERVRMQADLEPATMQQRP
jgi:thiamine biosynthesis lipoprotein